MATEEWQLEVARRANRDVVKLPPLVQRRVLKSFEGLTTIPRTGDIKKLAGTANDYRLRIGD